jgi:hypothetical protein
MPNVFPLVDRLLAPFTPALGADFTGYRNHVQRVLNHVQALSGGVAPPDTVLLAAPFHDLGIWTARSFDYLAPSIQLALAHLASERLEQHGPEVAALINEHHKLRRYHGPFAATVETYRRADLVDVSLGLVRFGLPRAHVRAVHKAFPDAGFHRRLASLTAQQFLRTPLRPLPMFHW